MNYEEIGLSELIDTISDTKKIEKDEVILINTSDVFNGDVLNHTYVENNNLRGQFKKRFKTDDILYSEIRPANKRFAYIDFNSEDYIASTKLMVLRKKSDKITNRFLYYCLTNDMFVNKMQHLAEARSGTFPQITFDVLKNEYIKLPALENQTKITIILDNINNKIKLNNEMNNNLYTIASNLINHYFDKNYDKEEYKEVIKFIKGKKPKDITTIYQNGYEKYLTIACLNGEENNYANPDKMLMTEHDILMVMDGASSGDTYFSSYGIVGSTLSKIEIINDNYISEYVFFTLKKYKDDIQSQTTGSAIPHTNKDIVLNLEIPKIELDEQLRFKSLLEQILHNNEENVRLSELRDALLPKLMNGEINLDNIEI